MQIVFSDQYITMADGLNENAVSLLTLDGCFLVSSHKAVLCIFQFLTLACHREKRKSVFTYFKKHLDFCIRYDVYQTTPNTYKESQVQILP